MTVEEINPFIRRAFLLNKTPSSKRVINADCRLVYVLEGEGEITIGDKTYSFEEDALGLWKSGTDYCWKFSKNKNSKLAIINFDYTRNFSFKSDILPLLTDGCLSDDLIFDEGNFTDSQSLNEPIFLNNMHLFKGDVLKIIEEADNKKLYSSELSSSLLKLLIIKIIRQTSSASLPQTKIEFILEYIKENYDKEITNISLGELSNYHPHYINALMKAYTGTTLHAYLLECRLSAALELIVNSDEGIENIAFKVGFKNPTHFCNVFRKKYGVSPLVYRKSSKII